MSNKEKKSFITFIPGRHEIFGRQSSRWGPSQVRRSHGHGGTRRREKWPPVSINQL